MDETGFALGAPEGPVVAVKGEKHVHKVAMFHDL